MTLRLYHHEYRVRFSVSHEAVAKEKDIGLRTFGKPQWLVGTFSRQLVWFCFCVF